MAGSDASRSAPGPASARISVPASVRGRHLTGLDGLRALAVIGVVAYHLNIGAASGGFLGVDLFFVLSGFLITSLLVEERLATTKVALVNFWARRAKRLLPALFTMLAVVIAFMATVDRQGVTTSLSTLRGDALATVFYVANWHLILTKQSYFALFAAPSPFQHTWSLAIEEQFYLLFPFVAVALTSRFTAQRRRASWLAMSALAVASAVEMALLFHPGSDPTRVYYGTDTRAFDLLIGAALAFATAGRGPVSERTGRVLEIAVWPAVVVLGWFWVTAGTASEMPKDFMYRGGFFLCALLAALLIAAAALRPQSSFARVLSLKPLVAIGLISYGIYLWHWPIIVLLNQNEVHLTGWQLDVLQVAVILGVSAASYFLIERPLRRRRYSKIESRVLLPATFAAISLVVVVGTLPSVALPPAAAAAVTPVVGVGPDGVIPGSGGFAHQQPIALGRTVSPADPLRVGFIGDSLLYYAYPGIAAALASTAEVKTDSFAFPGWGLVGEESPTGLVTAATPAQISARIAGLASFRTSFAPDVVIGTWTWDNAYAAQNPVVYDRLLELAVKTLTEGPGAAKGVILVPFPTPGPAPSFYRASIETTLFNAQAEAAWDRAINVVRTRMPGKVLVVPAGDSVLLHHKFTKWLPPGNWPTAPYSQWVQIRMTDNTHLCPNGVVRFASALLADLQQLFGVGSAGSAWVDGPWTRTAVYTTGLGGDRTSCISPHPPT
jgi:peptidoglycan/LPS O-acetylase OafA/YrhL